LILSGHGDHDWRATTPFIRRILEETGRFDVRVCETPAGLSARTLADFDLLVDHCAGSALGSVTDHAIAEFVESGKGLVVTHAALASCASAKGPEGHQASSPGAPTVGPRYWPLEATGATHTPLHFLQVNHARADHPIVQGTQTGFMTADAIVRGMSVRPEAEVIATAREAAATPGRGADLPVIAAAKHGEGRVVAIVLGHNLAAIQERGFMACFARAAEWAATAAVRLPADLDPRRPNADAVRALLIAGGHDHETAFYTLFDGYTDLAWIPVASSATAFQSDLRGKYDVLVMYDFSRDLDETGKKNIRQFAESGKGIVVLHHALLNYQKWPWWYQNVVGGSYRLAPEGNIPSSTVKADQEMLVTSPIRHPITAGIVPFHIVDESYKRMWISPQSQPLLSTDNPNSDRTIAWLSSFGHSRVVAIQLGHGHSAFGHPAYRALVHNAILWAAGRLK
jgi:type 1 glutamine amidotransferase